MAAWAPVLAEFFDCDSCTRGASGILACPKESHVDKSEALELVAGGKFPSSMPMIFRAEACGVCPRVLLSRFSALVAKAYSWWENGQLGLTLVTAPAWVDDAFGILSSERAKAMRYQLKNKTR